MIAPYARRIPAFNALAKTRPNGLAGSSKGATSLRIPPRTRRYSGARNARKKTLISACFCQLPLRFVGTQRDESGAELCLERDRTLSASVKRT
jgi:hypothetical protein